MGTEALPRDVEEADSLPWRSVSLASQWMVPSYLLEAGYTTTTTLRIVKRLKVILLSQCVDESIKLCIETFHVSFILERMPKLKAKKTNLARR